MSMLLKRRKQKYFILFAIISAVMILVSSRIGSGYFYKIYRTNLTSYFENILQVPLILVDSYYYGKFVVTPFNAVRYNVFNKNGGPELYGVEGFAYYIVNLMLNFNLVLVGSLFSLPMMVRMKYDSNNRVSYLKRKLTSFPLIKILSKIFMTTRKHKMLESSHWLCVTSMLLWLLVFSLQPHKEERFMYPIYPLICASAALTIKLIEQFVVGTKQPYSSPFFKVIVGICCVMLLGLSLSRVLSVHQGKS